MQKENSGVKSTTGNKNKLREKPPPQTITPKPVSVSLAQILAKSVIATLSEASRPSLFGLLAHLLQTEKRKKRHISLEKQKIAVVKELIESGIDPGIFDALLSNETDRRLKVKFGVVFLALTFFFTLGSYSIVILDGIFDWKISDVAITALIIETPIQFIGLLYIIARNLFPQQRSDIEMK